MLRMQTVQTQSQNVTILIVRKIPQILSVTQRKIQ
jgi:hypothetical protein